MRSYLATNENTGEIIVWKKSSNNFGDQVINHYRIDDNGDYFDIFMEINEENNWIEFTKKYCLKSIGRKVLPNGFKWFEA